MLVYIFFVNTLLLHSLGTGQFLLQIAQFGADFPDSGENVRRTKGARLGQRGAVFVTFLI